MKMLEKVSSHEQFSQEMKDHKMTVILDTDTHKQLSFSGDDFEHAFSIVAFPYHIMIVGDMGCYTFSRTKDMLRWFVKDAGKALERPEIELSRWRNKLVSVDSQLGVVTKSLRLLVEHVEECKSSFLERYPDEAKHIEEEFDTLLQSRDDGVEMLLCEMYLFEITLDGEDFHLSQDFDDEDIEVYVSQFAWCCYALNFGVGMYLESKHLEAK